MHLVVLLQHVVLEHEGLEVALGEDDAVSGHEVVGDQVEEDPNDSRMEHGNRLLGNYSTAYRLQQ